MVLIRKRTQRPTSYTTVYQQDDQWTSKDIFNALFLTNIILKLLHDGSEISKQKIKIENYISTYWICNILINRDLRIIEGELRKERQMKGTSSTLNSYTTVHQQNDRWTSKDIFNALSYELSLTKGSSNYIKDKG